MQYKPVILIFCCLLFGCQKMFAQTTFSKIAVDGKMKNKFSFTKKWAYSWDVFKDDRTGKFSKNDGQKIVRGDTAHLFFTANCQTNIQGGYTIKYCYANKNKDTITLVFSDGLPAYASEFYVYITGDSFACEPKTIYESFLPGHKITYEVLKQKLVLNKHRYAMNDIIKGYIDFEFIEIYSVPNEGIEKSSLYLRGYFKTPLKTTDKLK